MADWLTGAIAVLGLRPVPPRPQAAMTPGPSPLGARGRPGRLVHQRISDDQPDACVTIALSGPVTVDASTSVGSLTLSGSTGASEFVFQNFAASFAIAGNSSIGDRWTVTTSHASPKIVMSGSSTLTNDGMLDPTTSLEFVGNLTNAATV